MMRWMILGAALLLAAPVAAEEYGACLAEANARFERDLERGRAAPAPDNLEIIRRDPFDYCGSLAIAVCDGAEAPLACQRDLAETISGFQARLWAELPMPDEVAGVEGPWSAYLYPLLYALAEGRSAGPDCSGSDEVYETWCVARRASLKLAETVAAWQLARLLDVVPPAETVGWVGAGSPPRPTPRP